ncbi:hypothetical protein D3C71_2055030 [compost metagenome]
MINSPGATNINANSIGSVIPVRKLVSAAVSITGATNFREFEAVLRTTASAAAGSPNIMTG